MTAPEPPDDAGSEDVQSVTSDGGRDPDVGLDSNVAGALAYVLGPVSGALVLVLDDGDDFARFHAIQSIGFCIAWILVYVLLGVLATMVAFVPVLGAHVETVLAVVYPLVALVGFSVWAVACYKAYAGERFRIPVVGGLVTTD